MYLIEDYSKIRGIYDDKNIALFEFLNLYCQGTFLLSLKYYEKNKIDPKFNEYNIGQFQTLDRETGKYVQKFYFRKDGHMINMSVEFDTNNSFFENIKNKKLRELIYQSNQDFNYRYKLYGYYKEHQMLKRLNREKKIERRRLRALNK